MKRCEEPSYTVLDTTLTNEERCEWHARLREMSATEGTPRTWTLTGSRHEPAVNEVGAPWLRSGERVEVIEAEPVLDLLQALWEIAIDAPGRPYRGPVIMGVEALLCAHGRLKGGDA